MWIKMSHSFVVGMNSFIVQQSNWNKSKFYLCFPTKCIPFFKIDIKTFNYKIINQENKQGAKDLIFMTRKIGYDPKLSHKSTIDLNSYVILVVFIHITSNWCPY
jgi:hypothetical protein